MSGTQHYIGTSGFDYNEWKGDFYPAGVKQADRLAYYATRFNTVEINNTFYRNPSSKKIDMWTAAVGDSFAFSVKATRRVTHDAQLESPGIDEPLHYLLGAMDRMADTGRFGTLLFQLPPAFRMDLPLLLEFVQRLEGRRAAFEFRHKSWYTDAVYDALAQHDCAFCISDSERGPVDATVIPPAKWGYLRLRREHYSDEDVAGWADRIAAQDWHTAFTFFKHEEEGLSPRLATQLRGLLCPD